MKISFKTQFSGRLLSIACLLLVVSCAPAHMPSISDNLVPTPAKPVYTDLTQLLMSLPEVKVAGSRETALITIRRNTRFNTTESPVFVVNGLPMGNDYTYIYQVVRVQDIRHIEVLNDSEALSTYGFSGENGAIVIRTAFSKK